MQLREGSTGEKKIKGRKRHIVTDTAGHILHVEVHAANIHDTVAGGSIMVPEFRTTKGEK